VVELLRGAADFSADFSAPPGNPLVVRDRLDVLHLIAVERPLDRDPVGADTRRAMSPTNMDVVGAVFEAWNRRDFEGAVAHTANDVELHFIGGFSDVMGTEWKGRDGMLQFWRDWLGTLGGCIVVESLLDAGDQVVVIGTMDAVGDTSGARSVIRFGQVWSFRDGKVARIDGYYDPSAALEAVGLSE
jgi:ketosteroid isomerase-like protein